MESRHVSVWINASPRTVYEFVADLQTWPSWAVDSPMGRVLVEPAPRNEFGVLDHVVRLPSGEKVYNPMRVQPGDTEDAGCEVVFAVRRRWGMSDAEFDADAAAVAADLATLRGLIES